jgi:formylglycine-generating enzyme required for sulfatase activity
MSKFEKLNVRLFALITSKKLNIIFVFFICNSLLAQENSTNAIQSISASLQNSNVVVKMEFKEKFSKVPDVFKANNLEKIYVDFIQTNNEIGKTTINLNVGQVRSADVIVIPGRTRIVLNMLKGLSYESKIIGSTLLITINYPNRLMETKNLTSDSNNSLLDPTREISFSKKHNDEEHAIRAEFRDCKECPEMVIVPTGSFTRQDESREVSITKKGNEQIINLFDYQKEGPTYLVNIEKPFAVGKFSVTFDEWNVCVKQGGCDGYEPKNSWNNGRMPVVYVNWQDAQNYVQWLSKKTGKQYRLLSEAEWEYAARARTTTSRYWGEEMGVDHANCCATKWDDTKLAPVGSFEPNGFGLHDMLGHVWQWTQDCWHEDYKGAPVNGSAWVENGTCSKRTVRGANYQSILSIIRVDYRFNVDTSRRGYDGGFRVARTL